jgi:hypothetical protein
LTRAAALRAVPRELFAPGVPLERAYEDAAIITKRRGEESIARAQQLAGRALGDTARQHLAEAAFTACVNDPAQTAQLTDRSVCHGTAGLLTVARRIAADALTAVPLEPARRLHQRATAAVDEPAGFLDGAAGAALAAAGTSTTSWDACLLLC